MLPRFLIILLFFPSLVHSQNLVPPGQWKEYLPYGSAIKVAASNSLIYCATPYSLFSFNPTNSEVSRYSRITGQAETGISTIAYDDVSQNLMIAYNNSNLDIVSANKIVNIPDLKRKNYTGDKNIYNIYFSTNKAYLSTGLGIVVIDELRNETKDTYVIGNTGNNIKVSGTTTDASFIYAATTEGLKRAALTRDLTNFQNWQVLTSGNIQDVINFHNQVIFLKNDSLFVLSGIAPIYLYSDGWQLTNITVSNDKLLISENKPMVNGRIISIFANGIIETIAPHDA